MEVQSRVERAKTQIAALVAVGAVTLGAAGCSTDTDVDAASARKAAATAVEYTKHFDESPEADQLPLVDEYADLKAANNFIVTAELNTAVEGEPLEDGKTSPYEQLYNEDEATKRLGDSMPHGESAPVLDFMINSAGKLVYKDLTPGDGVSGEDAKIIHYVAEQKGILEPALRARDIDVIHFRVDKPNTADDDSVTTEAQFVPIDYNDNGKPAVYFQMKGADYIDEDTIVRVLGHEDMHAMLGQGKPGEGYTEGDKLLLNKACVSLRDNALEAINNYGYGIVENLRIARSAMKKAYRPAMDRVIKAVEANTYAKLPVLHSDGTTPNCFAQTPGDAYLAAAKAEGLQHIGEPYKQDTESSSRFYEAMTQVTADWDAAAKQSKVFTALSESTYLPPSLENRDWGHAYQNTDELTATLADLAEGVPEELGQNVQLLEPAQKVSVMTIAARNVERLKLTHPREPDFIRHIEDQYETSSRRWVCRVRRSECNQGIYFMLPSPRLDALDVIIVVDG